jgi:TonB-dependent receptor
MIKRDAADVTFDYKLTPEDRISFSLLSTMNHFASMAHTLTFNVLQVLPGDFTPRSTHGAAGRGSVTIDNIGAFRDNATYMATLVWRHVGAVWRADAGIAHSQAEGYEAGGPHGAFRTAAAQRSNVTVSFDNFGARTPAAITVRDGPTGAPVDPYSIDTYAMSSAGDTMVRNSDLKRTAYLNVARSFNGRVPFSLKAGLDLRQAMRDERRRSLALTFVGADGRTSTTPVGGDDQAAPFLDAHTSLRSAPFGFQRWQRLSADKLWTYYQANPSHFAEDANASYRSLIASSKRAEEIVSAGYLRGDIVFNDRLKLTGGVRAEQANIRAEGPLTDPARNYQLDAKGDAILGSNGQPLPITNNPLQISRLTYLDRSSHAEKEYLRLFPSLNASFSVRENLVARAAYYYSLGRPDFNQYAGGLTLPDVESAPSPNNRIVVNNAGIKPWTARSTSARLDYYFAGVGQVSIGGFRRDFKNFWGNSVTAVTPEFLALYGLDPAEYSRYDVSTQQNIQSTLRMTGWTISYKQALTFLPRWARGMQVFANGTQLRLAGEESARGNLNTFFPRSASWGVSLDRAKFNLRTNFNYRSPRRTTLITGASIDPNTYYWDGSKLSIDVLGEYRLGKQFSVFANLRNANVALDTDYQYYGPRTPAFAKSQGIGEAGALWTFGVKGGF